MPQKQTDLERFTSKTVPEPNSGCLLWTAATDTWGYGRFRLGDGVSPAHRVAWELINGPVPDGLCVLHRCDVPPCVNTDHLFLGTDKDNCRDKYRKGRDWQSQRSHCPKGHAHTPENTYINGGRGYCRPCITAKTARQRAEKRARIGGYAIGH